MTKITPQLITTATSALEQLEPGFLPLEVFNQVARLVRLPMVDLVPVKIENNNLQIGLVKRADDDLWWPSMWHLPGTVLRSTDTIDTAIERLKAEELALQSCETPVFQGFSVQKSQRGAEIVLIYTAANCTFENPSKVEWFPVDALPEQFVESERNVVEKVRQGFSIT